MSFLSPAFLLGLPLVAVPVVIHLLSRRQQKRISWGAMRFLMQAETRKRRLWRLTDLLLLALRTAAFLFFIGALARPLFPASWLGGSVPRDVILVLDTSLSMSRRVNGPSLVERQAQAANELFDELRSGDSIRVLLAGESPEWLSRESVPAGSAAARKLQAQIGELRPTLGAADLLACVREAADLEAPKDKSARAVVVISDGQRFGWRMDEAPLWSAVQSRLERSAIRTTVGIEWVARDDRPGPNLAVNAVETPRTFGSVGQTLSFTASVANRGTEPSEATLLSWRVNDAGAGVATVPPLEPGAGTTLTLSHPFVSSGTFDVSCEVEARDGIAGDDTGHCLVDVYERLPVLLVAEPFTGEPLESDVGFVLAALGADAAGASSGWRSVFQPTVIAPTSLATTDLRSYRCVVLADVGVLPAPVMDALEAYVQKGGGLWLALGARTDERFYNDRWYRGGSGLAPQRLDGTVGDANDREQFVSVRAASDSHPATALLSDFQRLDLDRARVYRRHRFDASTGRDVSVLIQAQGGESVVVERRVGRGRVLVQAVPLGVAWSTLPLCQAYVAMLHEWLWYLSEPDLPRRNLAVGEAIEHPAVRRDAAASLVLPDARSIGLPAGEAPSGPQYRYPATRWPGIYSLQVPGTHRVATTEMFHVRRNPLESDLAELTAKDREAWAGIPAIRVGNGLGELTTGGDTPPPPPPHPLEGWLLAALPFLLLGEMALAGWTTHRRHLRVRPVSMDG